MEQRKTTAAKKLNQLMKLFVPPRLADRTQVTVELMAWSSSVCHRLFVTDVI